MSFNEPLTTGFSIGETSEVKTSDDLLAIVGVVIPAVHPGTRWFTSSPPGASAWRLSASSWSCSQLITCVFIPELEQREGSLR